MHVHFTVLIDTIRLDYIIYKIQTIFIKWRCSKVVNAID